MSFTGVVRVQSRKEMALQLLAFLLGALFLYAGILKVVNPARFATDIDNYKILPWSLAICLAFFLPWLEILCGLALISRRLYSGGLALVNVLTTAFIIASITAKVRGLDITCGCFGHASDNLGFSWHLILDFAILAASFLLWRSGRVS